MMTIRRIDLHLDNAAVGADVKNLATELVGEVGDALQVLVLVAQSLASSQAAGVEVIADLSQRAICTSDLAALTLRGNGRGNLTVVSQQLLKVLGAQDVDLGEQQLTLDKCSIGVIQDGPNRDQILELSAGLLDDAVLASEHNGHAREVLDLGAANNEGVDVEAAGGKNAGDAGQNTGLVLDQAVKDVAGRGSQRGTRSLVEDVGHGGLGGPGGRRIVHREGSLTTAEGLVGDSRGGGGRI